MGIHHINTIFTAGSCWSLAESRLCEPGNWFISVYKIYKVRSKNNPFGVYLAITFLYYVSMYENKSKNKKTCSYRSFSTDIKYLVFILLRSTQFRWVSCYSVYFLTPFLASHCLCKILREALWISFSVWVALTRYPAS